MNWRYITILITLFSASSLSCLAQNRSQMLANQLIIGLYSNQNVESLLVQLAELKPEALKADLMNDSFKIPFWINVYNSAVQLAKPDSAARNKYKSFFRNNGLVIAGKKLSLDDIEHGMLRKSKTARGKKKRTKWFVSDFEKALRVNQPDWRVYFTLNTGLVGDPYISFYDNQAYLTQLKLVSNFYIKQHLNKQQVTLNNNFSWYALDAQDNQQILTYLKLVNPNVTSFQIEKRSPKQVKLNYFLGTK